MTVPTAFRFLTNGALAASSASTVVLFAGETVTLAENDRPWFWMAPHAAMDEATGRSPESSPSPVSGDAPVVIVAAPAPEEAIATAPSIEVTAQPAAEHSTPPSAPDLFAQFARLFADFDGEQALAALLQSDWARHNGWTDAGHAPLG